MLDSLISCTIFCLRHFSIQVYGNTSFHTKNIDSRKSSEEPSRSAVESCLSSSSCDEHLNAYPDNFRPTNARPAVHQDSDDSDSEIFRVKRRSTQKVDKRNANEGMSSMHSDHQVHNPFFFVSQALESDGSPG